MDPAIGDLIRTAETGNETAVDQLFTALYGELRNIAERRLRLNGSELTLGTTTLLHEAYLNISAREGVSFPDQARFLGYASRAMRGLIIDYARSRRAKKRGGEFHITLSGAQDAADEAAPRQWEHLGEALEILSRVDPTLAELVDLHFFAGFSLAEIAAMRGVSERTVQRDWRRARLLLHRTLQDDHPEDLPAASER